MSERKQTIRERVASRLLPRMRKTSPRMRNINIVAAIAATFLAIATIVILGQILLAYKSAGDKSMRYDNAQRAAQQLQDTSDFLTNNARLYVAEGDRTNLEDYLLELNVTDHRGEALRTLEAEATDAEAVRALREAVRKSDDLSQTELYAMRLAADARDMQDPPAAIADVQLSERDAGLQNGDKLAVAQGLLNGDDYNEQKLSIREQVQLCSSQLVGALRVELEGSNDSLRVLTALMYTCVILLLLVVFFIITSTMFLLLWPISLHQESIRQGQPLVPGGVKELRYLTDTYNKMYEKNHQKTESLQYEARYDALTGILNRASYDQLLFERRHDSALILVDVDNFKNFNDDFGHEMGDAVLIEVAATLYASFRTTDHVCRIGGDEFAVIMTESGPELKEVIETKINKVATFLRDTSNGLPSVTISVGVAFGNVGSTEDSLFNAADGALYETKRNGRDGLTFSHDA